MTTLPEPANRSIVAWGGFANQVRIRIDEWTTDGTDNHWYPADDNTAHEPTNWAALNTNLRHYGTPYLLVPQHFPPEPDPDGTSRPVDPWTPPDPMHNLLPGEPPF